MSRLKGVFVVHDPLEEDSHLGWPVQVFDEVMESLPGLSLLKSVNDGSVRSSKPTIGFLDRRREQAIFAPEVVKNGLLPGASDSRDLIEAGAFEALFAKRLEGRIEKLLS